MDLGRHEGNWSLEKRFMVFLINEVVPYKYIRGLGIYLLKGCSHSISLPNDSFMEVSTQPLKPRPLKMEESNQIFSLELSCLYRMSR